MIDKNVKLLTNNNLKLAESEQKSLKNFVTLKTEKKKDSTFSRMSNKDLIEFDQFAYGKKNVVYESRRKTIVPLKRVLFNKVKEIKEVSVTDFTSLNLIGRGHFGEISLVEHNQTKDLYALKTMKKDILLKYEQVESAILEKKILQTLEHPFLLSLTFCLQTDDKLSFIMPFIK